MHRCDTSYQKSFKKRANYKFAHNENDEIAENA
jgi:hypothetical protein